MGLVVSREAFRALRDTLAEEDRVAFTNGCFDLLHYGHVALLTRARALGDCLVVGLNSDDSVKRLKGETRPVVPQALRAKALAAMPMVDFVIIFDEDDPIETIRAVRPAIHVKGGDWNAAELPETPVVEACGGSVVILPQVTQYTSTQIADARSKEAAPPCRS